MEYVRVALIDLEEVVHLILGIEEIEGIGTSKDDDFLAQNLDLAMAF